MIIRETDDSFIMIKQHDHAFLSGELMQHFNKGLLTSEFLFDDALYAVYQHDRSWIGLDSTPIWNDNLGIPYTFSDYPLLPKLAFYKIGLDEIESVNPYSSLVCSLHFCSFFSQSHNKDCLEFLRQEARRQTEIKLMLPELEESLLQQHFYLLQFADNLSLYLCLNEPGIDKKNEHPWFKNGFRNTELFHQGSQLLNAQWVTENEVTLDSFPFITEFNVSLHSKRVSKKAVEEMGIAQAYEKTEMDEHRIVFSK